MIIPATWKLPEGHFSVAAFATAEEARQHVQMDLVNRADGKFAFYLTDKRGAWEVIRYPI
ncbi:hypothetical protein H5V43_01715 [Sphingobium fuliginis]|jgi:hypothetical protein|uniref:Uncharacterized protein n=1 Tax=Sphingobium fuliginis (strain ATCC 27551) TaxID=336203 RepID=A0A7M2GGS4_SPHSA|nr:hypothetical protein [Sphingobium fuliginis]QOT71920.1 hypothetical protein H5V43_01715 [Sphingobium fuliginis]